MLVERDLVSHTPAKSLSPRLRGWPHPRLGEADASTSIERQREAIGAWAAGNGHIVMAITEDVDVSGAASPFERPALGKYLNGHKDGWWDVLVAAKLDRISRSIRDFGGLVAWCRKNKDPGRPGPGPRPVHADGRDDGQPPGDLRRDARPAETSPGRREP